MLGLLNDKMLNYDKIETIDEEPYSRLQSDGFKLTVNDMMATADHSTQNTFSNLINSDLSRNKNSVRG